MDTSLAFPDADPFQRLAEEHRRLVESLGLADFERQRRLLQETLRLDHFAEPARRLAEQFRDLQAISSAASNALGSEWQTLSERILRDSHALRNLHAGQLAGLGHVARQAQEMADLVSQATKPWLGAFESETQRTVDEWVLGLSESLSARGEETEVSLEEVAELTAREFHRLPPESRDSLDPVALLSLIVALFFGFWGIWAAQATEERFSGTVDDLTAELHDMQVDDDSARTALSELVATALTSLGDRNGGATHSLSRRRHLRATPSTEAQSLGVFKVGAEVEVLQMSEGWAAVLVPIDADGAVLVGWMEARGLRALPR